MFALLSGTAIGTVHYTEFILFVVVGDVLMLCTYQNRYRQIYKSGTTFILCQK